MSLDYKQEARPKQVKIRLPKTINIPQAKQKASPVSKKKASPISKSSSAMRSCASIRRNWITELQQSEQMKQCLTIISILSNLIKDDVLKRTLEALRIKVVSLELEGPVQFAN
jgi:hypothetical protein